METNKILSFEEFATRGTDTATAEPNVDTTSTTDVTEVPTDTTDAEVNTDAETEETTTDTEETTNDTEEVEDSEENTEEDVEEAEDVENVKTVAEMVEDLKNGMISEATTWEADEYSEHTTTSYLKENAALVAATTCNALEELNANDEGYTKEAYEAALNEIKEAYTKKVDECMEAFGSNEETETENTEDAVIASPAK